MIFFKKELSVQSRSLLSENEKVLLKEAIDSREIEYLVHFTQTSNIESIVKYGLFARNILSTLPNKCMCNDDLRLDKREDCCCVSIGFPNHSMFYKYRKDDESIKWAVIGLKKEVLIDKECFFCFTNAASNSIRSLDDSKLRGVSAFNLLYANDEERTRQGLKKSWPTDVQAEVLVKGCIDPLYIFGISVNDEGLAEKYRQKYPHLNEIHCSPYFFNSRGYNNNG